MIATLIHTEQLVAKAGFVLPKPAKPIASYVPARRVGELVFVSGQIPVIDGRLIAEGTVPNEVDVETAIKCARQCVLNAIAAVYTAIKPEEGIDQIVRLGCFVASVPGFVDQPKIANGASELLVSVFGEPGKHARAAVGCIALPINAPVEIELIAQIGRA
ncbi:MAG TPA: RidA family protein [Phycisphaerales bacterium]|nr:RidA family protein [Phycisphaerales bacterium]